MVGQEGDACTVNVVKGVVVLWCMQTEDLKTSKVKARWIVGKMILCTHLDSTIDIPTEPEYYQALE